MVGRRSLAGLAVVAAGALLTGCGGGSRPADPHTAFLARVDRVCARAVAAHAGHPFPFADFDPEHPDPGRLPAVGDYFARYGGLAPTTTALRALTPPTSDSAAWHTLLDLAGQMAANAQRQIAAARGRDVPGFVRTVATTNGLVPEINDAGARFGFTRRSACGQVFG